MVERVTLNTYFVDRGRLDIWREVHHLRTHHVPKAILTCFVSNDVIATHNAAHTVRDPENKSTADS